MAFTRTGQESAASPLSFEVRLCADQSGALIQKSRKLYLQPAFLRAGSQPENLQNQAGPVDDFDTQTRFQVSLLNRRERTIHDRDCAIVFFKVVGKSIQQTAGEEHRRIHFSDVVCVNKCKFAAQCFNQASRFLHPLFSRTIYR